MRYIVEEDSTHSNHSHILLHRALANLGHTVVAAAVLQRNKGIEAWRLVLQTAQTIEVVYTLLYGLNMAVKHCAVGRYIHIVGCTMHRQPLLRRALIGTYLCTQLLIENLGSTTRYSLHTRLLQTAQTLDNRDAGTAYHI